MPWQRGGLIYACDAQPGREWALSHAQCPTPDRISAATLRVYFGTRDAANRTQPTFVDVDPEHPERIQYAHERPILDLGELGCFDDLGVIPSCIVNVDGAKWLYYAGCNTSTSVPYRMSIGVAVSEDGGYRFRRLRQGPILDRTLDEPHFCSTPFVVCEGHDWRMWYLSCFGWRIIGGRPEPQYHIKIARSEDGLHWHRDGAVAITHADEAIARPGFFRAQIVGGCGIAIAVSMAIGPIKSVAIASVMPNLPTTAQPGSVGTSQEDWVQRREAGIAR